MKPVAVHDPGLPKTDQPPQALLALAERVSSPLVTQCGVTTTHDGRWALYVTVPADAEVPLSDLERQVDGYPVVYEAEPTEPVRAGPAHPKRRR